MSMNNTRIDYIWPYALRGSVTLIIENTTIENFETTIYRNLRQSIAKIIRRFCSKSQENCLSKDTDAIRYGEEIKKKDSLFDCLLELIMLLFKVMMNKSIIIVYMSQYLLKIHIVVQLL